MSKFDYTIHKIIGVGRKEYSSQTYARVYALGYIDSAWHFVPFKKDEMQGIFCNEGYVHYSNALDKFCNKLISFNVFESDGYQDDPKITRFKVNYQGMDFYNHTSVINVSKQDLAESIEANGCDRYYKVGASRLYKFTKSDRKKGIGKYWKLDEDFFQRNVGNVVRNEEDIYIIKDDIEDRLFSYGEMYDVPQIVTFISGLISKYNINPNSLNAIPDGLSELMGIPMKILQFRFDEYNKALEYITLTYNRIMQISSNTLLSEVLQRSIQEYEDEYIKLYEKHHKEHLQKLENEKVDVLKKQEAELSELESAHNKRIEEIDKVIASKEALLQQVISKISTQTDEVEKQEKRFAEIESHKARLIEDFSVIRDVIGEGSTTSNKPQRLFTRAIESHNSQGSEITTREEFVRVLAAHLQNSELTRGIAENIFKLIVGRNDDEINLGVILFPSVKVIKPLLRTIGQYNLLSISVAPNWSSYEDLYNNGLADIIDSAVADNDRIHILLLQNMNLSYIPSYMQPINDCLYGLSNTLPTSNGGVEYPSNLLIFGTRTKQEAISVSEEDIELYGCLDNTDYYEEYQEDIEVKEGFISMSFIEQYREDLYSYSSSPESYVD